MERKLVSTLYGPFTRFPALETSFKFFPALLIWHTPALRLSRCGSGAVPIITPVSGPVVIKHCSAIAEPFRKKVCLSVNMVGCSISPLPLIPSARTIVVGFVTPEALRCLPLRISTYPTEHYVIIIKMARVTVSARTRKLVPIIVCIIRHHSAID